AVHTAHPDMTVEEAMRKMTIGRIRHLPVMQDNTIVGMISIGDVVKSRIMRQDTEVDSLRAYIGGAA
ncbi:MAG: CBS domain-containing protein, partial [Acetobacteraceae bacterium]